MGLAGVVETSAKEGLQSLDDAFFIATVNAMDFKQSQGAGGLLPVTEAQKRPRF